MQSMELGNDSLLCRTNNSDPPEFVPEDTNYGRRENSDRPKLETATSKSRLY